MQTWTTASVKNLRLYKKVPLMQADTKIVTDRLQIIVTHIQIKLMCGCACVCVITKNNFGKSFTLSN